MTTVFISGSMNIKHLDEEVLHRLQNIVESSHSVIVGDADGVDTAVQSFLLSNRATKVVVYCTGRQPRNNIGQWNVRPIESDSKPGTRDYFTAKDTKMADDCDCGLLIWDTRSTGTLKNALELLLRNKPSVVYVNKIRTFKKIKSIEDFEALLDFMSPTSLKKAEEKMGLKGKVTSLRHQQRQLFALDRR